MKTTSLTLGANLEEHVSSDMLRLRKSPARSQGNVVRKDHEHLSGCSDGVTRHRTEREPPPVRALET